MTQIRSYRRVFDLERRIYSVEGMRLNPSGVPLRGVVYMLCAIAGAIFAARLPVVGAPVRALPWFVWDVVAPAALATVLTVVRVDGRAFHSVARSAIVYLLSPRRTIALGGRSRAGARWRPHDLLMLADGADPDVRSFWYRGPGAVLVRVAHRSEGRGHVVLPRKQARSGTRLIVSRGARRLTRGRVVRVEAGTSVLVIAPRRGETR